MTHTDLTRALCAPCERFSAVHPCPCDHAERRAFERKLRAMVGALPRSIRFPYGEQAYGLTTYSAVPKHGRRSV